MFHFLKNEIKYNIIMDIKSNDVNTHDNINQSDIELQPLTQENNNIGLPQQEVDSNLKIICKSPICRIIRIILGFILGLYILLRLISTDVNDKGIIISYKFVYIYEGFNADVIIQFNNDNDISKSREIPVYSHIKDLDKLFTNMTTNYPLGSSINFTRSSSNSFWIIFDIILFGLILTDFANLMNPS
jgi:hypothetical protein